jgi:uncharacterized protein with FMN-binding domain
MNAPRTQKPALNPIPPRAVVTIVATALGVVLLFTFKTPDQPPPRSVAPPPSEHAQASAAPTASGSPNLITRASPTPNPTAKGGTTTVTGQDVPNQFGDVQVQVTWSGGRITDVKALQLPFDRARSAEISQAVEPYLREEALQAQSAQIDLISGATYTSISYARSLQSAIDKAPG